MRAVETAHKLDYRTRLNRLIDHWQAANYLSAAQLYLRDNPLLREPLRAEHIKPRLLGHWGTVPGLNLVYTHLNRLILDTDAQVLLIVGPGHGAPAILSNLWMEGTLGEYYPDMQQDLHGIGQLIRQFSWPYGQPSHLYPGTPGMIHEGGELGYCLLHSCGAAFDNPALLVACVIGDGEAETAALAGSWHSNKFMNPATCGAVLPILHLNGYKIGCPTIMGRMSNEELHQLFTGYGYQVRFVSGDDPAIVHHAMWQAMDWAHGEITDIKHRYAGGLVPQLWPMIVMRTPKGWTCPKTVDGKPVEDTFRAHQIPVPTPAQNPEHLAILEEWLRSYKPQEHFTDHGELVPELQEMCPTGDRRIGRCPQANGGQLLVDLELPDYTDYAVDVTVPGDVLARPTMQLSYFIRDVMKASSEQRNFRFFCPDEIDSNKMTPILEASGRAWMWPILSTDENMDRDGRVMEILSEHACQGWLEGYLLTGRHGLFACYEAFIPIIDSMLNQYAKWLKVSHETAWRKPISSLNYLLTSHVWRQDHNGFTHQVPTFINNVVNKKSSVARVYLPPDANCLLSVGDHCLRSRDYVNLIVASKQLHPQWLDMQAASEHCARGASVWEWACNDGEHADIVLACCGDVPTIETLAAAWILRRELPDLRVRLVNVVDLFTIMSHHDHPHGLDDEAFEQLFGRSDQVIFAFHGYPRLIHELLHHRPDPQRFHVRGYMEEGSTTTPFDMLVLNRMSRFQLVIAALERIGRLRSRTGEVIDRMNRKLTEHAKHIRATSEDLPEIVEWKWSQQ